MIFCQTTAFDIEILFIMSIYNVTILLLKSNFVLENPFNKPVLHRDVLT